MNVLSKAQRIRRRSDHGRVRKLGRRVRGRHLTLITAPGEAPHARLGVVASRHVGGAVARNRSKRLLREAFRSLAPSLPAVDAIATAGPSLKRATLVEVTRELAAMFRKARGT